MVLRKYLHLTKKHKIPGRTFRGGGQLASGRIDYPANDSFALGKRADQGKKHGRKQDQTGIKGAEGNLLIRGPAVGTRN